MSRKQNPEDIEAEARRKLGIGRRLQADRTPIPDPSRGGGAGYPVWYRNEQLQLFLAGMPTEVSIDSLQRWMRDGVGAKRTGIAKRVNSWIDTTQQEIRYFDG